MKKLFIVLFVLMLLLTSCAEFLCPAYGPVIPKNYKGNHLRK